MSSTGQRADRRERKRLRPGRCAARALFALSLLSLVMLPFARPQAQVWVESGTGEWFLADSLAGNLCLPGGGPLQSGGKGAHAFCGLCVMPAGGLGLAGQPDPVPQRAASATEASIAVAHDLVRHSAGAGHRPPARAPPLPRAV